eukprot:5163184-Pleurochrysis_carterae.AAC.1
MIPIRDPVARTVDPEAIQKRLLQHTHVHNFGQTETRSRAAKRMPAAARNLLRLALRHAYLFVKVLR